MSMTGEPTATERARVQALTARGAVAERTVVSIPRTGAEFGSSQTPDIKVGGRTVVIAAGPCAVEGHDTLLAAARAVRSAGAVMLRGGAFKPRTSPYTFQGLGAEAFDLLA
ncbi:MAG: 3-deoxy-7-phosphoheptulonate synthase, partial [Gemmatimonadaceae bacterium]